MKKPPQIGDTYKHLNGLCYHVLALAQDQDREELQVIHQGPDGTVWSRPIGNFMALKGGEPRFVLTEQAAPDSLQAALAPLVRSNSSEDTVALTVKSEEVRRARAAIGRFEADQSRMLADLTEAAAQLRKYETLHRAKGTPDSREKAEVNAALAARFEATIAAAVGGAE